MLQVRGTRPAWAAPQVAAGVGLLAGGPRLLWTHWTGATQIDGGLPGPQPLRMAGSATGRHGPASPGGPGLSGKYVGTPWTAGAVPPPLGRSADDTVVRRGILDPSSSAGRVLPSHRAWAHGPPSSAGLYRMAPTHCGDGARQSPYPGQRACGTAGPPCGSLRHPSACLWITSSTRC